MAGLGVHRCRRREKGRIERGRNLPVTVPSGVRVEGAQGRAWGVAEAGEARGAGAACALTPLVPERSLCFCVHPFVVSKTQGSAHARKSFASSNFPWKTLV